MYPLYYVLFSIFSIKQISGIIEHKNFLLYKQIFPWRSFPWTHTPPTYNFDSDDKSTSVILRF